MMGLCVDTSDAVKINELFMQLKEEDKNMSIAYMSALRDKEIADKSRQLQES